MTYFDLKMLCLFAEKFEGVACCFWDKLSLSLSLSLSLFLTHAHALAHTFKHLCSSSHSTCCVTSFDLRSTHTHLVTWICKNTHTLSLSRTLKLTHAPPLSLKHLFLILSNSNAYNYSLKHLRTLTHKHTQTSTHTHTGTHTHVLPHSHTHTDISLTLYGKSRFFHFRSKGEKII